MERIAGICPTASLQPPYSMLRRDIEQDLLAYCGQNKIGVVAYSPMQKGLLTGKFNLEYLKTLSPDDHRVQMDPNFKEPLFSQNLRRIDQLKKVAAELGITMAQLAIAWVLRRSEVTSAIVGARRKGQIVETAAAAKAELDNAALGRIEKILND
jgi:aryl-alcohol dehydrogenase-like predicted oxidoreductase